MTKNDNLQRAMMNERHRQADEAEHNAKTASIDRSIHNFKERLRERKQERETRYESHNWDKANRRCRDCGLSLKIFHSVRHGVRCLPSHYKE